MLMSVNNGMDVGVKVRRRTKIMVKIRKWKKISDEKVRTIWECPDCKDKAYVEPDWFQDNGTPMCGECDNDMDYLFTEIKE